MARASHITREDEVLIRARRPAGAQADFRVNLSGHLSYKFHQYKGKTCEKDVAPVMATLQDAYGISLSDKRVIWVNPDDQDQDARLTLMRHRREANEFSFVALAGRLSPRMRHTARCDIAW
jgi:hypothetical protein